MVIFSFCSIGIFPNTHRHALGSPHCLSSDRVWFVWFVWWINLLITSPALTKLIRSSSENESNPKQNGTDKQSITMKEWDTIWELKFNLQIAMLTNSLELKFPHTPTLPYLHLLVHFRTMTKLDISRPSPNRVFNFAKHLGFTPKIFCFRSFHSGKHWFKKFAFNETLACNKQTKKWYKNILPLTFKIKKSKLNACCDLWPNDSTLMNAPLRITTMLTTQLNWIRSGRFMSKWTFKKQPSIRTKSFWTKTTFCSFE